MRTFAHSALPLLLCTTLFGCGDSTAPSGAGGATASASNASASTSTTGTGTGTSGSGGGGGSPAKGPVPVWGRYAGDAATQYANRVAVDSASRSVVVGAFQGQVNLGGATFTDSTGGSVFIAQYDPSGTHLWSKAFGTGAQSQINGLTVDATGNIFITGSYFGTVNFGTDPLTSTGQADVFVVKLDPSGVAQWAKSYGGPVDDVGFAVALDASGSVIIGGGFQQSISFDGGAPLTSVLRRGFVAKLDKDGNHVWSRAIGGSSSTAQGQVSQLAIDPSGNIAIAGPLQSSFDVGAIHLTGTGTGPGYVGKLTSSGDAIWAHALSSGANIYPMRGLAVDASGAILVVGDFVGQIDFGSGPIASKGGANFGDAFLAKWDDGGTLLFDKTYGDVGDETLSDLAVGTDGDVYVTGSIHSQLSFGKTQLTATHPGENMMIVARLDPSGTEKWAAGFERDLRGLGCAFRPNGNLLISGIGWGVLDDANLMLQPHGPGGDALILELAPPP